MCNGHKTIWLDCPTCGNPQRPATRIKHVPAKHFRLPNPQGVYEEISPAHDIKVYVYEMVPVGYEKRTGGRGIKLVPEGRCAACGTTCRGRHVEMVGNGSGRERCTAACLNGKRRCDCHCGGRCHGAGQCHCGEERPAIAAA